ncbi:MAG: Mce-associated rane protein [Mycobacterium sp.]|jgi:Mce-associated membrane protein|nr:Mce-associated rane protein [Mycobacterium sp.]
MPVATDSELDDEAVDVLDDAAESAEEGSNVTPSRRSEGSSVRLAMLLGVAIVVVLATLVGWYGFRVHQAQQAQVQRSLVLQAARQGVVNLTTIDWQHADADVQRILDGATGQFHDDFASRAGPFVDVVKKAKSITVGTVTEAGLESETADTAQALVAVTVTTSNAGTTQPEPRGWRLRVFVQEVGDQAKVSNVEFVP